ncbi:MAG: hypothetical protein M0P74_09130 [Syntrophales bacterium]|jgi:hypothetical protein|nr:hypothetical protein [Syntrophales bacterium]
MIKKFTEKLAILLIGNIPEEIDTGEITDKHELYLANMLNQLIKFVQEVYDFIIPLSKGELANRRLY